MRLVSPVTGVALACALSAAVPSNAEFVYFPNGRAFSVRAVRSSGELLVLHLRNGGEVICSRDTIVRVEPDEVEYQDAETDGGPKPSRTPAAAVPSLYRPLVAAAAHRYDVDLQLVHAIIQVESGYRSRAVSPRGARGLMQLLPSTGRQYGALDLFDPAVNVDAGVRHLKSLLERFDLPVALAAYNAGEGAVSRFGGIPPFRETRRYVARVLDLLNRS